MKAKTINKILKAKISEWTATIEDENVRELAENGTIVTGGAIASMLLKEPVNDYDVYFKDRATALAVAKYYVGRFQPRNISGIPVEIRVDEDKPDRVGVYIQNSGIASEDGASSPYEYFESRADEDADAYVAQIIDNPGDIYDLEEKVQQEALTAEDAGKPKYRPVFMSSNAITLSHKIQLVFRFYGDANALHENYDFVHCTNYWTSWDSNLVLRQEALESLLARELRYVGSKYPICSIIRLRKFINRGWSINAGQILKMVMQVTDLDLTDISVLQDQLIGVDAAYFGQVIARLKQKDPEKVNGAYLVEIIDRIF